mgnify:FL=1
MLDRLIDLVPTWLRIKVMNKKEIIKRLRQCVIILGASLGMNVFTNIAVAEMPYVEFPSIDGGILETAEWRGKPYLVVNTASRCGFTGQYSAMQELYNKYRDKGFRLLAVPSDDFNQELNTDAEVKDFCELNYDLDMPMTSRLSIRGSKAHPFYRAVKSQSGFVPLWNFSKVLIGADGKLLGTWGPLTKPMSPKITKLIEAALSESF